MKRLDRFEYLEKLSFPSCRLWLWEVYNSQLFLFLFLAGELLHIVYGDLDMAQFRLSGLSSSYSADTVFFLPQMELSCLAFTPQGMSCLSGFNITGVFLFKSYFYIYSYIMNLRSLDYSCILYSMVHEKYRVIRVILYMIYTQGNMHL